MVRSAVAAVAAMLLAVAGVARADVWDLQAINDNTCASTNELVHGSEQLHDLGTLSGGSQFDRDWYRIGQRPYSSYEIVVDGTFGDVVTISLLRTNDACDSALQQSVATNLGYSRSLRFANNTANAVENEPILVWSPSCGTSCGPNEQYRIRAYETTYAIARFNNTGTQVTVLIVQNPSGYAIAGTAWFWSPTGVLLGSSPFNLSPRNTLVLSTATVVPEAAGSITVTNDGRYGDLAGKAVALDPATGFSFDTPMVPRPR